MKRCASFAGLILALMIGHFSFGQEASPAEKYAMRLQQTFQENGYDVEVLPLDHGKTLRLKSEMFKDPEWREAEASELYKERKTLCGLGIRDVKVGYSKGMLSSDVMKTLSLGCPAERSAQSAQAAEDRVKYAQSLDGAGASSGIRVSANGTILVFEADGFAVPAMRSRVVRTMMGDPNVVQNLCSLHFTQLQIKSKQRVVKTAPVVCK